MSTYPDLISYFVQNEMVILNQNIGDDPHIDAYMAFRSSNMQAPHGGNTLARVTLRVKNFTPTIKDVILP